MSLHAFYTGCVPNNCHWAHISIYTYIDTHTHIHIYDIFHRSLLSPIIIYPHQQHSSVWVSSRAVQTALLLTVSARVSLCHKKTQQQCPDKTPATLMKICELHASNWSSLHISLYFHPHETFSREILVEEKIVREHFYIMVL